MALVSRTIANLINGVSQQPPTIRNPTQCQLQENCLSDVVDGVVHRPHTSFIAKLQNLGPLPKIPYVHTINQNTTERYKVVVTNGDLKVFDLLGVEKTVTFPNGKGYLTATNPMAQFQCLTLGNKTYILNRTVTVTSFTVASDFDFTFGDDALVFIKQGDYATDYTVTAKIVETVAPLTFGPTAVTKTTSDTLPADIKTTKIATDLKTGLDTAFGVNLDTVRSGSVLWLSPRSGVIGANYTLAAIAVEDSKGNNNIKLVRSQIQKFSDLPTVAPTYYQVQVVGDKTSGYDDYYVRFFPDDPSATFGNGSWSETWAAGTHLAPRKTQMPLVLIDNGNGTFTCQEETWTPREAGDTETNPDPSFVGRTIQHLFTYGNRLGILSGDRVIMSEVGQYTNFYLTTVTTFLDSDPIDIQPLQGHDDWLYAVPLAEKVILFSQKGQAVVSGGGLLTPKTATLETATSYPVSPTCEPILVGNNIVFTADTGNYSKVYEYFVQKQVETLAASEITSHVPKYIPRGITRLTGSDDNRMVLAMGTQENDVGSWYDLWVYKYFWVGDQKVQSSWSRWMFPQNLMLVDATLIDGVVYFMSVDKNIGHLLFHSMDLDFTKTEGLASAYVRTHLDLRMNGATLTSSLLGTTRTITLPFHIAAGARSTLKVYRKEAQGSTPRVSWGVNVPITSWNASTLADSNQISFEDPTGLIGTNVWIGFPYTSTFTFSEIHLKEEKNGVQVPVETGKLSLRKMDILFTNSLYFRVEVTPSDRDTRTYPVTPWTVGSTTSIQNTLGRSGKVSVPVNSKNTEVTISVVNDSVVQHRLQSAEWTGQYTNLSQRI